MTSTLNFKIVVAGSGGVGKTTLLRRYQSGAFIPASTTIGVNFVTQQLEFEDKIIVLSLWDYAGEVRFKTLFPGYCSGSKAAFAVFDLTRPESLIDLSDWIAMIFEKNKNIPVLLVGSKSDAADPEKLELMKERANSFAKDHNLAGFWIVSSKTGEGVGELFDALGNKIVENLMVKVT
jgi:small GTP-binding protein